MMEVLLLAALMAVVIGANSSANCAAPAIGGRVISLKKGMVLTGIFIGLGIWLEGDKMIKSVSGGITTGAVPSNIIIFALAGALVATAVATYFKAPVSTSQSMVAAFVGTLFLANLTVNYGFVGKVLLGWFLTPVGAAILAVVFYIAYDKIQRRLPYLFAYQVSYVILILTTMYSAYVLGANTGGFLISAAGGGIADRGLLTLCIAAMVLGVGFSRGVIKTIGSEITTLGITTAMVSQLSAAMVVHFFTQLHIPVSLSQAIVGGVVGVGLAYGTGEVSRMKVLKIAGWWLLTPTIALLIAVAAILIF